MRARFAGLAAALLLAGCAAPSFSYSDYGLKAGHTAAETSSVVQTAWLAARMASEGKATAAYTEVVLTDAETAAGDIQDTFDSVQPPDERSDKLHDELDALLDEAADVLETLRIQQRRGRAAELAKIAEPLPGLNDKLTAFAEAHR